MVYRDFACSVCNKSIEVIYNSIQDEVPHTLKLKCDECNKLRVFDKLYSAPYHTFGMMTRQYTGQLAAVKGHGSHQLDYNVGDLAAKRAIDATIEYNEKANLHSINDDLKQRIKDIEQERT